MAFRLNDDLPPASGSGSGPEEHEAAQLRQVLEAGLPADQHRALARLVSLGAESTLLECLSSSNPVAVELATGGLWECWLNEQGPVARREIDRGIRKMESGNLEAALEIFSRLTAKYPGWAEAYNKQATVFYLLGNARLSYQVCQKVVELKPAHFGAWNGMALCAAQLEKWRAALDAARQALRLMPGAPGNHDLIRLAQQKLEEDPGPE